MFCNKETMDRITELRYKNRYQICEAEYLQLALGPKNAGHSHILMIF